MTLGAPLERTWIRWGRAGRHCARHLNYAMCLSADGPTRRRYNVMYVFRGDTQCPTHLTRSCGRLGAAPQLRKLAYLSLVIQTYLLGVLGHLANPKMAVLQAGSSSAAPMDVSEERNGVGDEHAYKSRQGQ